jgi:hypothetical protein
VADLAEPDVPRTAPAQLALGLELFGETLLPGVPDDHADAVHDDTETDGHHDPLAGGQVHHLRGGPA